MKKIFKFIISLIMLTPALLSINENAVKYPKLYPAPCSEPKELTQFNDSTTSSLDGIFLKNNFSSYYFYNLKENFGYNIKGSCSYVALDMMLSFYDTYWDDRIVAENYDSDSVKAEEHIICTSNSPGNKNEYKFSHLKEKYESGKTLSNDEYLNIIGEYDDRINHFNLLSIGVTSYKIYDDKSDNPCGTSLLTMRNIVEKYFDKLQDFPKNGINIGYDLIAPGMDYNSLRNIIINKIKNGIPVEINGADPNSNPREAHSYVAYDYDEENDEIYVHPGWQGESTHVSMTSLKYIDISEILYLEPTMEHYHSNNYYRINENGDSETMCSCQSVIPSSLHIKSGNYLDELPTFKWNSLINEKWFKSINLKHQISILDSNNLEIYTKNGIVDDKYTFSIDEWKIALNSSGSDYYIYIGLTSDDNSYWDDYYCLKSFEKPKSYNNKIQIKPSMWGFDGRYYFENEGIKTSELSCDGLNITTRRLRCGYIENSYINLSPRREGAGEAFFELTFDRPVYSFMYSICLWSANEGLNGSANVKVLNDKGNWIDYINLLEDIVLTTRIDGLKRYSHSFIIPTALIAFGIYGIRFEATASAIGDRNKGRICIDDLVFSTSFNLFDNFYYYYDYPKTSA